MSDQQDSTEALFGAIVKITRFLDESWPGYVECRLVDCTGKVWLFHDKVPVVAVGEINSDCTFPQPGIIACRVLDKRLQSDGREIVSIDTDFPWHIQATTGETQFKVFAEQLAAI